MNAIQNLTSVNRTVCTNRKIEYIVIHYFGALRHYDVTVKACPRPWVGEDINTYYGKTGNQLWAEFKARLTEIEDNNMVRYNTLDNIPNEYGFRDIIEILMNAKIIKGDGSDPNGNGDVIDLSHDQVRSLVFEYRGGAFDRKLIAEGKEPAVSA